MEKERKQNESGANQIPTRPSSAYNEFFIGNLPRGATEHDVLRFFSPFGPVEHFNMCRNSEGRARGYGWLRFCKDVPDLLKRPSYQMQNNTLTVEVAQVRRRNTYNLAAPTLRHRAHTHSSDKQMSDGGHRRIGGDKHPREETDEAVGVGGRDGLTASRPHRDRAAEHRNTHRDLPHSSYSQARDHNNNRIHDSSNDTNHAIHNTTDSSNNANNGSNKNNNSKYNTTRHHSSHIKSHRREMRSRASNPSAYFSRSVSSHSYASSCSRSRSSSRSSATRSSVRSANSRRGYRNHRRGERVGGGGGAAADAGRRDLANYVVSGKASHHSNTHNTNNTNSTNENTSSSHVHDRNSAYSQNHTYTPTSRIDDGTTSISALERAWQPPHSSEALNPSASTQRSSPNAPSSDLFVCLPMSLCPAQFMCDPRVFTARLDCHRVGALTICGSVMQPPPPAVKPALLHRPAPMPLSSSSASSAPPALSTQPPQSQLSAAQRHIAPSVMSAAIQSNVLPSSSAQATAPLQSPHGEVHTTPRSAAYLTASMHPSVVGAEYHSVYSDRSALTAAACSSSASAGMAGMHSVSLLEPPATASMMAPRPAPPPPPPPGPPPPPRNA